MSDYVHYGAPLKELELEEAPKKFKDETVRDEKGRRRFHGAFTGGFSAGYFNSVDTKEGWTPSNFVSSRSNRANKLEQKAQDYMDGEDLGELGFAPQRLQVQEGARIASGSQQSTPRTAGFGSQRELLSTPIRKILKGDRDSVGVLILRGMGWRDGKGIGPKVYLKASYGPQLPQDLAEAEVNPEDIEMTEIQGTDQVWGLGYVPATRLDLFEEKIDRERLTQTTAKVAGRRLGIRGQAFGVGAFEEDDEDIYAKDDMTQYVFEDVDHSAKGRMHDSKLPMIEPKKKRQFGGLLEGFVAVENHSELSSSPGSSVVIPADWKPKQICENVAPNVKELNKEQKVAALNDNLPEGSIFHLLSEEARAKLEARRQAIQNRTAKPSEAVKSVEDLTAHVRNKVVTDQDDKPLGEINITTLRPFAKDPQKQERFERYISFAERGHRELLASLHPPHFSAWEAALEKKDFEAALLIVRPQLGLANRFESRASDNPHTSLPTGLTSLSDIPSVSAEPVELSGKGPPIRPLADFGVKTHCRFTWHPSSLLCKRFNVPDPYPGNDFVGIPASSLALDHPQIELEKEEGAQPPVQENPVPYQMKPKESLEGAVATPKVQKAVVQIEEMEPAKSPPPLDIFKMIFSDDDDESDDNKEEVKQKEASNEDAPEPCSTSNDAGRKNTGIFADLDLSLLNKRPPPKDVSASKPEDAFKTNSEEKLLPMGPKPPPILAIETEIVHKLTSKKLKKHKLKSKKRKKDSKLKKKPKKKEKHKKRRRDDLSSESESTNDEVRESSYRKTNKKKREKNRKRSRQEKSTDSSDDESEEEQLDKRLKNK